MLQRTLSVGFIAPDLPTKAQHRRAGPLRFMKSRTADSGIIPRKIE
jgi:hypothetical protein